MRNSRIVLRGAAVVVCACGILGPWNPTLRGDEPGRFGRFFRFGGSNAPASVPDSSTRTSEPARDVPPFPPASPAVQPRLIPQPRNYRGVTDADPIVTRVALGRTTEGATFGMFLQVFADGTVIDSEGVHQVGREGIKPVLAALNADELYRLKGHCGAPPTDFIEHVHIVVFERSLGRLRANAFSFSGNPQGCDASVRRLQGALDALQASYNRGSTRPAPPTALVPDEESSPPVLAPTATPAAPTLRLNEGIDRP